MMKSELLILAAAAFVFVVLVLSSKVLRTVLRESVMRPKEHCDIHVGGNRVVVVHRDKSDGGEA